MKLATVDKPEINWTNIEAGLGAIAFGLILFVIGWKSAILDIFAGFLSILGSVYLASVPEVRFYFNLVINRFNRKQVFKNEGTISRSNTVSNMDTGGGPANFQQIIGEPKVPFLRATVDLAPVLGTDKVELQIDLKNIGDGIATNIEGELVLAGGNPANVLDTSPLNMLPIGPSESALGRVSNVPDDVLRGFASYSLSIRYKDVSGNAIKSFELKGTGDQLRKKLSDESWPRSRPIRIQMRK
jgi:hypothetical protein